MQQKEIELHAKPRHKDTNEIIRRLNGAYRIRFEKASFFSRKPVVRYGNWEIRGKENILRTLLL